MPVALIVGATGLVGAYITRKLKRLDGWRCIGMGRRRPDDLAACSLDDFVACDLLDRAACQRARVKLADVSHVFHLARVLKPGYAIPIKDNENMLLNLLDALSDAHDLEHVQVMHGLKWYGSHQKPFSIPARESDPRPTGIETFYYAQRDALEKRQKGQRWTYSTLRPHCVSGVSVGSPSNLMLGIGMLGALMKEAGQVLRYPGSRQAFAAQLTYTDAGLLADAMHWAATSAKAANQDFNVANGDVFSWQQVWPGLAAYFGVEAGEPCIDGFSEKMVGMKDVWQDMARRHGLVNNAYEQLVSWPFVEASLGLAWDQVMSTNKLVEHGFTQKTDTLSMIFRILDSYRESRIIP
ncbi:MAG: SDR family oxidoreductase [Pusillimonas sp.]